MPIIFFGVSSSELIVNGAPTTDEISDISSENFSFILWGLSNLANGKNPVDALETIKASMQENDGSLGDDIKKAIVDGGMIYVEEQGNLEIDDIGILKTSTELTNTITELINNDFYSRFTAKKLEVPDRVLNLDATLLSPSILAKYDIGYFTLKYGEDKQPILNNSIDPKSLTDTALVVEFTDKVTGASKTEAVNISVNTIAPGLLFR